MTLPNIYLLRNYSSRLEFSIDYPKVVTKEQSYMVHAAVSLVWHQTPQFDVLEKEHQSMGPCLLVHTQEIGCTNI